MEISALREMIEKGELKDIGWVPAANQLADCLTKQGANADPLIAVLKQQMRFDLPHLAFVSPW